MRYRIWFWKCIVISNIIIEFCIRKIIFACPNIMLKMYLFFVFLLHYFGIFKKGNHIFLSSHSVTGGGYVPRSFLRVQKIILTMYMFFVLHYIGIFKMYPFFVLHYSGVFKRGITYPFPLILSLVADMCPDNADTVSAALHCNVFSRT